MGWLLAVLLALNLPTAAAVFQAPGERRIDEKVGQVQDDLEGTSAELSAAYARLRQLQTRVPALRAALADAVLAAEAAERRERELALQVAITAAREDAARRALSVSGAEIRRSRVAVGRLVRAAYERRGTPALAVALNTTNPEELTNRLILWESVARRERRAVGVLEVRQLEQRAQRERLESALQRTEAMRAKAEISRRRLVEARAVVAQSSRELDAAIAAQRRQIGQLVARRDEEERLLQALGQEKARLDALVRRRTATGPGTHQPPHQDAPWASTGRLLRPTQGPVTSPYGWRIHPIYGYRRMHTGTDLGSACGTSVLAPADGTVIRAGRAGGYGNQLVVDHGRLRGRALATSYNHLMGFAARTGPVRRGQVIAYVGSTGASTGCHLHWEVFVNGGNVDPMTWL